jgi:hypothetical protein
LNEAEAARILASEAGSDTLALGREEISERQRDTLIAQYVLGRLPVQFHTDPDGWLATKVLAKHRAEIEAFIKEKTRAGASDTESDSK